MSVFPRSRLTRTQNGKMDDERKNEGDRQQKLYSEKILDHYRNPRNYGSLPAPAITREIFNPLCGDRIRIELEIEDGRIEAAHFVGDGCAISIAAASLLTESITGRELNLEVSSEQLLSALESEIIPSRIRCALLALEAYRSAVEAYRRPEADSAGMFSEQAQKKARDHVPESMEQE